MACLGSTTNPSPPVEKRSRFRLYDYGTHHGGNLSCLTTCFQKILLKTLAFLSILVLAPLTALADTADDPESLRNISPSEFDEDGTFTLLGTGQAPTSLMR